MADTYVTKQGETVDLVCLAYYGRTAEVTERVLAANPGLAALGIVLPIGTEIIMPDAPAKTGSTGLVSLWG
ncbi:MAG: phage tail protein [Shinella sp.]|nr:MAG: phage tail protein [Shinella sp.]